jgi:hypothetical protein
MNLLGIIARSAALIKFASEQRVTVRDFPNDIYLKTRFRFFFHIIFQIILLVDHHPKTQHHVVRGRI